MQYSILHNGVPIGSVELDLTQDPAVGIVHPAAAYDSIRERIRAATKAFRETAFGSLENAPSKSSSLADGASIGRELELRDDEQQLVKVDFIDLADWEGKPLDVTVWVRARGALSGVKAPFPGKSAGDRSSLRSDA